MKRLRVGIIGLGYIGISHIEAINRINYVQTAAVTDSNIQLARQRAEEYGIEKIYETTEEMLSDKSIDAIHNCTPNHLHMEINKKVLRSGKHLFSEKPLTTTAENGAELVELLSQYPDTVAGVNFNYRMNPLVQEMRQRIIRGDIGMPRLIHGSYLQDWLLYDTDYNWRIEPEFCGPSRCIADIGSHWMDMAQYLLDTRIAEVNADLLTAYPVRKKAKGEVSTFSVSQSGEYEEVEVATEDYAAVLFKMENGVRGVFYVSQISAGHGCFLNIEINGSKSSLAWNQENCDQLWQGFRDEDNRHIIRNPNHMTEHARLYSALAKGHPEGWNDAFKNSISSFYSYILQNESRDGVKPDFATFQDAYYLLRITEAILESGKTGRWVKINN